MVFIIDLDSENSFRCENSEDQRLFYQKKLK